LPGGSRGLGDVYKRQLHDSRFWAKALPMLLNSSSCVLLFCVDVVIF
jgi:hypothetical protein